MKITTLGVAFALILSCIGCKPRDSTVKADTNGFVLGDDTKAPRSLIVGVGESVDQFLGLNTFLRRLNILGEDHVLKLPLMTRTIATYDDGEIKFRVGCSFTTNIDGNNGHVGINSVTFKLCEPAINDWTLATRRTAALIAELERDNPKLVNLREFRKTASLAETEKNWGGHLVDRWTKVEFPLTEEQANQFLKNAADGGHIQQLQFSQGSYLSMAALMNDKVSIDIGISKETYWGGQNLTEEQKKTMKYQTVISFWQRKSAATPCTITEDWLRCRA